ncbi:MAG: hypothetical protein OXT65_06130 [Alphaproteobacteria bacterium]|nr:hypothetical protein [Alphaproteobacteria bacterium]
MKFVNDKMTGIIAAFMAANAIGCAGASQNVATTTPTTPSSGEETAATPEHCDGTVPFNAYSGDLTGVQYYGPVSNREDGCIRTVDELMDEPVDRSGEPKGYPRPKLSAQDQAYVDQYGPK